MFNFLKKTTIKRISSFDSISAKLLLLVIFSVLIPLFAITNQSINFFSDELQKIETQNIHKNDADLKVIYQNNIRFLTLLFLTSLFTAIFFAIIFSRKITLPVLDLVKTAKDISDGNLDTKAPIKGNDEIAKLAKAFNSMSEKLKQQQKLRDNFLAALTHDLRVPMLAENKTIDYMLDNLYGPLTDEQRDVLSIIKSTNNSSLEMVGTLLDIYKYDSGQEQLKKTDFDIIELLNVCINEIKSLAQEKNIEFQIDTNSKKIQINADKIEFKRMLHNLINNSINNLDINGKITCSITATLDDVLYKPSESEYLATSLNESLNLKNTVMIRIKDTGIGIASNEIPYLFSKFSLSKGRKPAGTGVGLYFSKLVSDRHNAIIWCESTVGKGSGFNILLKPEAKDEQYN